MNVEHRLRIQMVAQGADPHRALEAVGVLIRGLSEDLQGIKLMRDWSHSSSSEHRHIFYHPEKGMLGAVTLHPLGHHDLNQATRASMTIQSVDNPNAVDDIRRRTPNMGPSYKVGAGSVRGVLRTLKSLYPNLKRIDSSTRVTGVRTHGDQSGRPAQINLERGAGALRGVDAVNDVDRRTTRSPHSPSEVEEYHSVLNHYGWTPTSASNRSYSHPNHPGHEISRTVFSRRSGGWEHYDNNNVNPDTGEVHRLDHGVTPADLDTYLTSFHGTSSTMFRGHQFGPSSEERRIQEPRDHDIHAMHQTLRQRGWNVSDINGVNNGDHSVWRHDEHPEHEIYVNHWVHPENQTGNAFEVINSSGHTSHSGSHDQLANTLDNWYPTSAPTGRRSTAGTHDYSDSRRRTPLNQNDPDVREMHTALQQSGWRTELPVDVDHPEHSTWMHPDHPDHQMRVMHQPDEDGDYTWRHYHDGAHQTGGTVSDIDRHLTRFNNEQAVRNGEQHLMRTTLQNYGYKPLQNHNAGDETWVSQFHHHDHTVSLSRDGRWFHAGSNGGEFSRTGTNSTSLDHTLEDLHGSHWPSHVKMHKVLVEHGYAHESSNEENQQFKHLGTGHTTVVHNNGWIHSNQHGHILHGGEGSSSLDDHLSNVHASAATQETLLSRGWFRVPGVSSSYHSGGPVWNHASSHLGAIHINTDVGRGGHEPHWTHHPSRRHFPDDAPTHGRSSDLAPFLNGLNLRQVPYVEEPHES